MQRSFETPQNYNFQTTGWIVLLHAWKREFLVFCFVFSNIVSADDASLSFLEFRKWAANEVISWEVIMSLGSHQSFYSVCLSPIAPNKNCLIHKNAGRMDWFIPLKHREKTFGCINAMFCCYYSMGQKEREKSLWE